jgi:hypothetical protein
LTVQAIDRLGALPATAAARSVESARPADPEKPLDEVPHAADFRAAASLKLLGTFGKNRVRL